VAGPDAMFREIEKPGSPFGPPNANCAAPWDAKRRGPFQPFPAGWIGPWRAGWNGPRILDKARSTFPIPRESQGCHSTRGLVIWLEVTPCPQCGATRTDSVDHGLVYSLLWKFGYRLRRCSRCRFPRLISRHIHVHEETDAKPADKSSQRGAAPGEEQAPAAAKMAVPPDADKAAVPLTPVRSRRSCPRCSSTDYRRSRRTFVEHLLLRPKMARCKKCRNRFPYPAR
jgi:hypothetical protein